MQKIKILKPTNGYAPGEVLEVENNDAHAMIEAGTAVLFTPKTYDHKQMLPETPKKGYKTKGK